VKQKSTEDQPIIYIITGGNGITGNFIVQAALAQFPKNRIPVVLKTDINTPAKLEKVVNEAFKVNAIIVHTMVNQTMRDMLKNLCVLSECKSIDMMGNLINLLSDELDEEPLNQPGMFRKANTEYFDRLESIDFAIKHDDGLNIESIHNSDIVLTGVSRTGKTPLSMYLAMLGWKVANVPLVKGIEIPRELFSMDNRRIFGLQINRNQLLAHRQKRFTEYENLPESEYNNPNAIRDELSFAQSVFIRGDFTEINVSNKAIETSANEILSFLSKRFDKSERRLKFPG